MRSVNWKEFKRAVDEAIRMKGLNDDEVHVSLIDISPFSYIEVLQSCQIDEPSERNEGKWILSII